MAYPHSEYLISVEELQQRIDDPSVRIFDTSVVLTPTGSSYTAEPGLAQYRQGHIPGAGFIDLSTDWSDTDSSYNNTLPSIAHLVAAIGADGIANDHTVVLYSSGHLMWATRAWWLLHYAGHSNVKILNGNLGAWRAAGLALRQGDERYPAATFTPQVKPDLFVSTQEIEAAIGTPTCMVNALSKSLYEGTGEVFYTRRGHIPGSRSVYFGQMLQDEFFLPENELKEVLEAQRMLSAERTLIYCGGGIAATLDGFACLLMGQNNVGVYDGSMSEWADSESRPLTLGPNP